MNKLENAMNVIEDGFEAMETPELTAEADLVYNQLTAETVIDFPQAPTLPIKTQKPRKPRAKTATELAASLPLPPTDPIVLPNSVTPAKKPRKPKQTPEEKAAVAEAKKAAKQAERDAKKAVKQAELVIC